MSAFTRVTSSSRLLASCPWRGPLRALLRAFKGGGYHDIDVSDGRVRREGPSATLPENAASIDELLDRAVAAINRGDRAAARPRIVIASASGDPMIKLPTVIIGVSSTRGSSSVTW